jgi:hypothetical protein
MTAPRRASGARLAAALAAAALALPASRAEVSVNGPGGNLYFQAEPGKIWTKHREAVATERLLNPFGDARGDGAPSIGTNPATGVVEVAWGRSGNWPGVMFASWDEGATSWNVREVARGAGASTWAGRLVQLLHDGRGNRFVAFDDPVTGRVLIASAPPWAQHVNRPILVNVTGRPGTSPHALVDAGSLLIAYGRLDAAGAIEIVEIELVTDDDGYIPNGGEGIPGIPEPVFTCVGQWAPVGPPHLPALLGSGAGPFEKPITLPRLELLADGRVLATWIDGDHVNYVTRSLERAWSTISTVPLPDPVDHESVRADIRHSLSLGRRGR